jgi:trans-aconitate 2-methyltransferase
LANWNAEEYHRSSFAQKSWADELITKLPLTGDEHLLDIGCGDGKVTAEIARRIPRGAALGVDSSEDMIRFAREHHPHAQFPNLSFRLADAGELPFDDEFDVVFSSAALHWVIDHAPVLSGIRRALHPGGRALLQMGGFGNAAELFEIADAMRGEEPWAAHFAAFVFPWGFYTPEEYEPWVVEAGLTPVRVDLIPKNTAQPGREGLLSWMRTTWMPYLAYLPEPLREPFMAEAVERYVAGHPVDADGSIHVRMVRLEVEALRP